MNVHVRIILTRIFWVSLLGVELYLTLPPMMQSSQSPPTAFHNFYHPFSVTSTKIHSDLLTHKQKHTVLSSPCQRCLLYFSKQQRVLELLGDSPCLHPCSSPPSPFLFICLEATHQRGSVMDKEILRHRLAMREATLLCAALYLKIYFCPPLFKPKSVDRVVFPCG